ncbi:hypothetical protein DACRYDRAFT_42349, partial [Dacryopinax primogenitus]
LALMHECILHAREVSVQRFRVKYHSQIRDYDFQPGALVLLRNSRNDGDLRDKMQPWYLGPYVMVCHNKRGSYIISELDGSIGRYAIAAFRLLPF